MKNLSETQKIVATAIITAFITMLLTQMAMNLSKTLEILAQ